MSTAGKEVLQSKLTPKLLARNCCKLALDKRAEDVVILDLRKLSAPTDYFVICSAPADKQVKAIATNIVDGIMGKGRKAWHVEGLSNLKWVLIDYVDVVVHVFNDETRRFYSLETLWGDAPAEEVRPPKRRARKR
jgi:ribosome-associated protein